MPLSVRMVKYQLKKGKIDVGVGSDSDLLLILYKKIAVITIFIVAPN